MAAESKDKFQLAFSEKNQTVLFKSGLSPEISPVDLEIRWFKETDCVFLYKNRWLIKRSNYENTDLPVEELKRGNVFLPLKDISESDVGDYLCQLTYRGITEEITLSLKPLEDFRQTEKTQQLTKLWKQTDKEWTDKERIKMANSALLAVLSTLEQRDHHTDYQHTSATMQINSLVENELDEEDNPDNQQPGHSDQRQIQSSDRSHEDEEKFNPLTKKLKMDKKGLSVFTILAGKTSDCHKKFIAGLQNRIEDLREVYSVDESDIVLLFCPIVSKARTDIDAALAKISYPTDSKLTVLVVLYHTFDPEKTVPDSSKCVNVENLLTVDCLFYEDEGLLKCQRNSDALDKSVDWLIAKGHNIAVTISQHKPRSFSDIFSGLFVSREKKNEVKISEDSTVNYFLSVTGDAQKHHMHFVKALQQKMSLRSVSAVEDSDVILLFCPEITDYHRRTAKPVVLISLYNTKYPESVKRMTGHEKRQTFLPVDCVFLEGQGLLDCQLNQEEINAVSHHINK